jgi:hypothetical protein
MNWEEFKKLLFKISHREGSNLICQNEEDAKELMIAIHQIDRYGLLLK